MLNEEIQLGMPVLCQYANAALFAYYAKVRISHILTHTLSLSIVIFFVPRHGLIRIFLPHNSSGYGPRTF